METTLITGGCGFIGSHFVRLLLQRTGWRVVNMDKLTYAGDLTRLKGIDEGGRYRLVQGDIADRSLVGRLLQEERPWAVVNFAAESHVDRSILDATPFLQTNVLGTQILLEGARRHGVQRFVQISTDEVYGDVEGLVPATEESALHPGSPYAASKAAADLLCLAYCRTYRMPALIVRCSNNYGPFQFPEKLIPLLCLNALAGKELPLYGDGLQRRDWLYVADACDAIFLILERGDVGSIYNVATGEERTNLEVVEALCRVLAAEGRDEGELLSRLRYVADRPGHDRRYAMQTRKICEELGWFPRTAFEEGLARTVKWTLDHQGWLQQVTSQEYLAYYEAVYKDRWGEAQ